MATRARDVLLSLATLLGVLGLGCQSAPSPGSLGPASDGVAAPARAAPSAAAPEAASGDTLHPLAGGPLDAPPGGADGAALFGPRAALATSIRQPAAACRLGAGVGVVHRLPALPHHAARRVECCAAWVTRSSGASSRRSGSRGCTPVP